MIRGELPQPPTLLDDLLWLIELAKRVADAEKRGRNVVYTRKGRGTMELPAANIIVHRLGHPTKG